MIRGLRNLQEYITSDDDMQNVATQSVSNSTAQASIRVDQSGTIRPAILLLTS